GFFYDLIDQTRPGDRIFFRTTIQPQLDADGKPVHVDDRFRWISALEGLEKKLRENLEEDSRVGNSPFETIRDSLFVMSLSPKKDGTVGVWVRYARRGPRLGDSAFTQMQAAITSSMKRSLPSGFFLEG